MYLSLCKVIIKQYSFRPSATCLHSPVYTGYHKIIVYCVDITQSIYYCFYGPSATCLHSSVRTTLNLYLFHGYTIHSNQSITCQKVFCQAFFQKSGRSQAFFKKAEKAEKNHFRNLRTSFSYVLLL